MSTSWIKAAYDYLKAAEQDVSLLSSVGDNPFINLMEREVKELLDLPSDRVVAVSSATSGMLAVLRALGIGKGDEVIVPAFSWGQTLNPVLEVGAIPVFVDVEAGGVNLDLSEVKAAKTHRTKAILAAELFGIPLDFGQLENIARRTGLFTIVDAAQSFGAIHQGRWPKAVVFSFGRGKLICGGEGGAVVTQSANLYDAILVASQHPVRALQNLVASTPFDALDSVAPNARIHPFAAALVAKGIENFRKQHHQYRQLISMTRKQLTEAGFPPVPIPSHSFPPVDGGDEGGAEQAPPVIPVLTDRAEALFAFCQTQGWKVEKCCRTPLVSLPTVTKRMYLPALRRLGFPSQKINVRYACDEYPQASVCAKSLYLIHSVFDCCPKFRTS
jgi:dTDP-4-amino-4,6-dideoxygalactose transaminase